MARRGCLHIDYDIETTQCNQILTKSIDRDTVTELIEEPRIRTNAVFAILSTYRKTKQEPCNGCTRIDAAGTHHSIAFWSPGWNYYDGYHPKELLHDYYRPGTQSGHLIPDSCGGPRCCKNLVPMRTDVNLSQWKTAFENQLSTTPGFSLCKITCTYNDGLDRRIPTQINGQSISFVLEDIFTSSDLTHNKKALADVVGTWLRQNAVDLKTSFATYAATPRTLHQKIYNALRSQSSAPLPLISPITTLEGRIQQSVMTPKRPVLRVKRNKLWALLDEYYEESTSIDYSGQLNLTPFSEHLITDFREAKKIRNFRKNQLYALPPRSQRPYEILDYLALNGLLDKCVLNSQGKYIAIDGIYLFKNFSKKTFPPEMRALIMVTNQWLLKNREEGLWNIPLDWMSLQGNIYRSDAKERGDVGDIGDGIVLDPQIDHIVPVSPPESPPSQGSSQLRKRRTKKKSSRYYDPFTIPEEPKMVSGFYRGPSVFSNAQLTSSQFNNQKRNRYFMNNLTLVYHAEIPDEVDFSFQIDNEYTFEAQNDIKSMVTEMFKKK